MITSPQEILLVLQAADIEGKIMASINEEKLVKVLECAICLDLYEEPKVLPCQHTYCRKCLEQLAFGDGRIRRVNCPECRRVIKVRLKTMYKILKFL